ncbi:MAG: chemotaxis protein CheX [Sulfurimonas sp.]|jgi:hypothetical protein|uniref:chemotaxis protein CheX n=1 Tax=Sulfurimonas sp. TaxID=2022749 RepID=UPI0026274396|nr:chemotaxis protein CheX [Sulfurimonas sp.]MDD3344755.1 chemotaxis protein CheX [Sulfurospirillaceae bacterium]MDD3475996.1 chemotaxis protein CheX [Sulfurimonas sp.]
MLNIIIEASQNFCIHQIRETHEVVACTDKMRTLIAYVDITMTSGKKHRVYIGASPNFAQRVTTILLEEDESDEETLVDMVLELTNLIVGSAKVLAQNMPECSYTMATPCFEKIDAFDIEYNEAKTIKVGNDEMIVAIKEI